MIEHRLPARLSNYWDKIRLNKTIPTIEMFNNQAVEDLWKKCFQVSLIVKNNAPVYTYDFIGEDLYDIFDKNLAGKKLESKLNFMPAKKMIEQMDKSIRNPFPITVDGQFIDENNNLIKYRSCLLPFGKSKEQVTHFVIGLSWKKFR